MESYGRAYPQLIRLQILREIEISKEYLLDPGKLASMKNDDNNVFGWERRMHSMSPSFRHRLGVLEIRRAIMALCGMNERITASWLDQSVSLRKSGRYDAALQALRHAERFGLDQDVAKLNV